MRTRLMPAMLLLVLSSGCATYVGTSEVGAKLSDRAVIQEDPSQAVITGNGHKVVVERGTGLVFIDESPVVLGHPTRLENGRLVVSDEIYKHLPGKTPVPSKTRPGTTSTTTPGPTTLKRYKLRSVVIDPGHGGEQAGARYGGVEEKTVNLDIALQVAALLRDRGLVVQLTRTSDTDVSLDERSAVANTSGADCLVSIHADAAGNTAARGVEVFHLDETFVHKGERYNDSSRAMELNRRRADDRQMTGSDLYPPAVSGWQLKKRREQSRVLAGKIEDVMVRRLATESRGLKTGGLAVLKWTACPAVLVEVGFLSNVSDRGRLSDPMYRTRAAEAIAEGILDFREWYELAE
ncbi:MAG TPA: N-acetylmuramoyl-L-alanine amidase [Acidimicrobiia bacterium]|nr:N-acetylmuramoyl-L-alanine amidase [Acidimicrobiia bacterium]